jgi:hypothetical protein
MGTMLLGFLFFLNQLDETFSHIGVDVANEASAVLVCLYIHLSHLIVCELGFMLVLFTHNIAHNGTDMVLELASIY